jgi:hypothetical protein
MPFIQRLNVNQVKSFVSELGSSLRSQQKQQHESTQEQSKAGYTFIAYLSKINRNINCQRRSLLEVVNQLFYLCPRITHNTLQF